MRGVCDMSCYSCGRLSLLHLDVLSTGSSSDKTQTASEHLHVSRLRQPPPTTPVSLYALHHAFGLLLNYGMLWVRPRPPASTNSTIVRI